MKIPKGFEVENGKNEDYCFKLNKNTYRQKQAGRVWNQYLVRKLKIIGFEQSEVDKCVFFKGKMVYVLYTDDSILAGPDRNEVDKTIALMMTQLNMTVEGELKDFLGVNIQREGDKFILTQPQLIDNILKSLRLKKNESAPRDTPMLSLV